VRTNGVRLERLAPAQVGERGAEAAATNIGPSGFNIDPWAEFEMPDIFYYFLFLFSGRIKKISMKNSENELKF
jgi:hypothetical protein